MGINEKKLQYMFQLCSLSLSGEQLLNCSWRGIGKYELIITTSPFDIYIVILGEEDFCIIWNCQDIEYFDMMCHYFAEIYVPVTTTP